MVKSVEMRALSPTGWYDGVQERFWSRVNMLGNCWEWQAALDGGGYGVFYYARKNVGAHRMAYFLWKSYLPPELNVLHHCDNRRCVRPEHLFLGTHQDNMDDRMKKGGYEGMGENLRQNPKREEAHYAAKLTEELVKKIRRQYREGKAIRDMAKELGIHEATLSGAISGRKWRHVREDS